MHYNINITTHTLKRLQILIISNKFKIYQRSRFFFIKYMRRNFSIILLKYSTIIFLCISAIDVDMKVHFVTAGYFLWEYLKCIYIYL